MFSVQRIAPFAVSLGLIACGGDEAPGGGRRGGGGSGGSQPTDGGEGGAGADTGTGGEAGAGAGRGGSGKGGRGGTSGKGGTSGDGGGEGGSGGDPEPARFSITVAPETLSLSRGASAWLTVRVEREAGFTDPVSITFEDLPDGFSAETLVLPAAVESGFLPLSSSPELPVGRVVELDAIGSSGAQRATASVELTTARAEPSSQEKIRAALAGSEIDYATSLLYRAYALFGDARLPEAFVGSGSDEEDNGLFDELWRELDGLPAPAQESLRPFFVRPADPESAWNPPAQAAHRRPRRSLAGAPPLPPTSCPAESGGAGTWISRRAASAAVRVWARCAGTVDGDVETERLVQKTLGVLQKIYGPMTGLMSYPIEDLEGGDEAIDFYIVDPGGSVVRRGESFAPGGLGSTYSDYPEVGNGASAFVVLPRMLLYTSRFHATVIHEFFHVLQKAYNHQYSPRGLMASGIHEAHWFPEASAVWASAHFDRTLAPWEDGRAAYLDAHRRFPQYFQKSTLALSASQPIPHTYAAYIWPYFVEQETESPDFMPQIWEGMMGVTSFDAADDAISAAFSFSENFKTFALRNLNVDYQPGDPLPENERYVSLDSIFPDRTAPDYLSQTLTPDQDVRQALELPNLSYRNVMLLATPMLRKVEVDFSGLQLAERLDVQALVSTRDGWLSEPLDFSDEERVVFCFDDGPTTLEKRGSFSSLLLVLSNHAIRASDTVTGELVVKPSTRPCTPVWTGTITMSYRGTVSNGVVTASSSASVAFEYDDMAPVGPYQTPYRLRSGTYVYDWLGDFTGRNPPCRTRERANGTMIPGGLFMSTPHGSNGTIIINSFLQPATYQGSGITLGFGTLTSNCNDNNIETTQDWYPTFTWWQTPYTAEVSEDGRTLEGEHSVPDVGDGMYTYRWQLTRVDE